MAGKGSGKSLKGGSGNGPTGKSKLHGVTPKSGGHKVGGKGIKLAGQAYQR